MREIIVLFSYLKPIYVYTEKQMNIFALELKLYINAERSMGEHLESYGREKLLD